ncbi:hypothetical protein [Okeania sp.]|uniref:hypothetical protein n=1 Tax=Okeania sp. TaxID=3100323 RepID=UPI002B4B8F15|nr:hypothetical protein [Okeania sp.]MEB3339992.1 hypothetical protein [Okeania sp.]
MHRKDFNTPSYIDEVKKLASDRNINVLEVDNLLDAIEKIFKVSISEKYKMMIYLAIRSFFKIEDMGEITENNICYFQCYATKLWSKVRLYA